MKLFPYDIAFSRAIRESYNWTCQVCGHENIEAQSTGKSRFTQCAHVYSRSIRSIRCHADNAMALCASCHAEMTMAPTEWGLFCLKHLGEGRYEMLKERRNDIRIKYSKLDWKDITKHYLQEYNRIVKLRMNGNQGYIPLISFD